MWLDDWYQNIFYSEYQTNHRIHSWNRTYIGVYWFANMFERVFYHFASRHPAVTKEKLKLKLKLLSLLTKFAIDSSLRCHDMKEAKSNWFDFLNNLLLVSLLRNCINVPSLLALFMYGDFILKYVSMLSSDAANLAHFLL